ncbi:Spaf_1101 family AAA-like ATPase [Clostridium cochlearium]|uniref:Rad50/SbcC-type AAA domain-containing protein n=1 Tax=Clostridium cochlearium TaxID=1494 RepID=A0A7Y3V688_CLOCO|nr:AAA family ATPase [Clostridium cochlearium]NOH15468.1 hypothetical protein [Clostridium cochlearium]
MANQVVLEQYNEIIKRQKTATFYKVDFHIHTPGSKKDYKVNGLEYERVGLDILEDIANKKGLFNNEKFRELYSSKDELMALLIIHEAYEVKGLNLIVITDHDNMDWYNKIISAAEKYILYISNRNKDFMILPGVEITCFSGTHVIGIFDNKNYEKVWEYIKFDLNGINEGNQKVFTFRSEMDVIKIIKKVNGIVYIPHLDNNAAGERIKDILDPLSGMSKAQLLTSEYVEAIGFTNYAFKEVVKSCLDNRKNQYYREKPLAYLKDSDAHCIEEIGTNIIYIKMEKPCFNSLKFALHDPELRVKDNISNKGDSTFIRGIVTRGGYLSKSENKYSYYPFSRELNCIVGGRGSGKSTLIKCLQSCLKGHAPSYNFRLFMGEFQCLLVYLYFNKSDYCIVCEPTIFKNEYTGEETNKYGEPVKGEITNISNWLKVYKISRDKCIKLNQDKQYLLLNDVYVDYFEQSQILRIGESNEPLKQLMETIILKSNNKKKYNILIDNLREKYTNISKYISIKNINDINNIKVLIDEITEIKAGIDEIRAQTISMLNSNMKNKVQIQFNRIDRTTLQLLGMALEEYCFREELNKLQQDKLSRVIDYVSSKYDLFDINIKIIENSELLIREIYSSGVLNGQSQIEIENDETKFQDYILMFYQICKEALKKSYRNADIEKVSIMFNVNSHDQGKKKVLYKPLSELSLGQRAVAILTIITEGMSSLDVTVPLIIDQPEDQLDNRFIYKHLITTIRELKERRQVILVTHNANIPVSGDAENVMCLVSDNENGWLDMYGSLDNIKIQNKIIDILEGGEESFKLRLSKYRI